MASEADQLAAEIARLQAKQRAIHEKEERRLAHERKLQTKVLIGASPVKRGALEEGMSGHMQMLICNISILSSSTNRDPTTSSTLTTSLRTSCLTPSAEPPRVSSTIAWPFIASSITRSQQSTHISRTANAESYR